VRETLAMLVELQGLEDALRDLRINRARLATLRSENTQTKALFEEMLTRQKEQIDETQGFCSEKEEDIKAAEESARRARTRLTGVTSQRELTALNKELEIARRVNRQRTEEVVKLLDQLEAAQATYVSKESEWAALEVEMQSLEASLVSDIEVRESQASDHRARQADLRSKFDKTVLARFDRVSKGRGGQAVANVVNAVCSACQVAVAPQQLIRLMRMASLESCQNCRRMLVDREFLDGAAQEATSQ
jgi:predicted  nucleic acid-binding Zn-ribbon protein